MVLLVLASCSRIKEERIPGSEMECYPEGTPVTMKLGFGTPDFLDVKIGTKAEASAADESSVRELYVMLFDTNGNKFYGRNFSYGQKMSNLSTLDASEHDCWYVETDANGVTTRGVVKLSTVSKPNCTLVVLANVSNTISHIGTASRVVDYLAGISTLSQLQATKVTLEQDIVTRSDLFLMMGTASGVNTGSMIWGSINPETYYSTDYTSEANPPTKPYQIELKTLDAKVKFRVKYNTTNIDPDTSYSRNWRVYNVPTSCYLFDNNHSSDSFFDTEEAFFDGTETDNSGTWQVFTFYMLENYQTQKQSVSQDYYLREKQDKNNDSDHPGYKVNGDWVYAPDNGTYVWFDMVLGLTSAGVAAVLGSVEDPNNPSQIAQAMTSKAAFTVHLGDFSNTSLDDYTVKRGHCYTYNISIENTSKIYVEVVTETTEDQPGQEGSLLLVTEGIVNCDAHYEYHELEFNYSEDYLDSGISWYIKTPFSTGGEGECEDFLWVMFAVNEVSDGVYEQKRLPYPVNPNPGDDSWFAYDPAWIPTSGDERPPLMDINQLVGYIINETRKEQAYRVDNTKPQSAYKDGKILVTAYVDEYYYEFDPREYKPTNVAEVTSLRPAPNPDLWRQFVNKPPRELHILANTRYSQDRQSDVILANNSIIQQSIQTFYNIYSPDLSSIWGTEHLDEMEYRTRFNKLDSQVQWPWWPLASEGYFDRSISSNPTDAENGRINTARIWDLPLSGNDYPSWDKFLDYGVNNNTPELRSGFDENGGNYNQNNDYKFLAYSCLTRNRDNNHNGVIDPEEVRWYTAAVNQLVGMWVGNESLTPSARLYHPMDATNKSDGTKWRSWVISSTGSSVTNPNTIRAEEGCTKSNYNFYNWAGFTNEQRDKVSSIRCVRNIGTYQDGGTLKDISYAPFDRMVDQYYEFPAGSDGNGKANANQDGTYTIRFSRLNPKSIREYSADELPYHDEYSIHNCVYQELIVQDKTQFRYADGSMPSKYPEDTGDTLDEEVLNNAITSKGHNYYCPDGYRLPNMTELLMMEALLPSSYWSNSFVYPCRTYYSHGVLGKDPVTSETDEGKVGWGKESGKVHIINQDYRITGIRCVRDENRTGVITGAVSVDDANMLMHSTDDHDRYMNVHLNISSLGSAIRSLDITLVYTNAGGMEESIDVTPEDLSFSGVSVRKEVRCKIPSYDDLPILGNISLHVTVRNHASATPKVFEVPITLLSPVFTSIRLLHCNYDENAVNPPFPVLVTASSASGISSMTLKVMDPEGITNSYSLFTGGGNSDTYKSFVHNYLYRTNNSQEGTAPVLIPGTYSFLLEVVSGGQTTRSDVATMELLLVEQQFNSGTIESYNDATEIDQLWEPSQVDNLDFYAGDFIEANMDISTCQYKEVIVNGNRNNDLTIGRDDLISVGLTDTDHGTGMTVPYVFHIYYPAHDGGQDSGQDWLRPNPSTSAGKSNGYNYKSFQYGDGTGFEPKVVSKNTYAKPKMTAQQHFRFEQYGVYWNNQLIDLDQFSGDADPDKANASFNMLRDAHTVYVGSTQGFHHSRAKYHFVRAVHNGSSSNSIGGDTNFGNDPVNGGDL